MDIKNTLHVQVLGNLQLVQPGLEHLALVLGRPHQASKGGVDDPLPLHLLVVSKLAQTCNLDILRSNVLQVSGCIMEQVLRG